MLPFMILQPVPPEITGKATESAELLPSDATEPAASFADLLQLDRAVPVPAAPVEGIPLPPAGNALPPAELREVAAAAALPVKGRMSPAPVPTRLEWAPVAPQSADTAREAAHRVIAPQQTGLQSGAVTDPAKPDPLRHLPRVEATVAPEKSAGAAEPTPAARPERPLMDLPVRPAPDAAERPVVPLPARQAGAVPEPAAVRRDVSNPHPMTAKRIDAPAAVPVAATPRDAQRELFVRRLGATATAPGAPNPTTQPAPAPAAQAADFNVLPSAQATTAPVTTPVPTVTTASPEPPLPAAQLHTSIDVPVRDAAWAEQLGERVQLMANSRLQTAEIRLTPAELGPVRVQIAVDDGTANVTFQAQHAITRDVIEQALPRLRELLAESGLTLNQASVDGEGVRHGSRQAGDGGRDTSAAAQNGTDAAADGVPEDGEDTTRSRRAGDGLVDTFA